MRIDTSRREWAKAKISKVYFCSLFHDERGEDLTGYFCPFRVYEARDDADHEALIFGLRKWVDPPVSP